MRLVVMNSEEGFAEDECGGLSGAESGEQGAGQAGSARGSDGINPVGLDRGIAEGGTGDGQEVL
jgi:hypothetical protein